MGQANQTLPSEDQQPLARRASAVRRVRAGSEYRRSSNGEIGLEPTETAFPGPEPDIQWVLGLLLYSELIVD